MHISLRCAKKIIRIGNIFLCLHCISNLKWYQPSEDTTVVKQYGIKTKKNVSILF
jgi:hypothetical protein